MAMSGLYDYRLIFSVILNIVPVHFIMMFQKKPWTSLDLFFELTLLTASEKNIGQPRVKSVAFLFAQ